RHSTAAGPVSSGGSSSTAVSPAPTRAPHSGQKLLPFGSAEPQFSQLAPGMHLLLRALGVERSQRLGGAPAQRPDLGAVVVVGDLSRAVVELELLQRSQGAVTLLGKRDPLLLVLGRLAQAVVGSSRVAEE